jgi:NAD(P)-dependent dehydrogenase (short-subunit alcohol dehydrogenase family)
MRIDFKGRVAIVTGGLGRQHSLALAARGARVLANDLGTAQAVDALGPGGHPGQQCRHPARQELCQDDARRLPPGAGGPRHGRGPLQQGGLADHDRAAVRPDHHDHVVQRPVRQLRRGQDGAGGGLV